MNQVYKIVQDKIVKAIQEVIDGKEERLPWQKPWIGSKPINYVTRRPYSGVNLLLLEGGEYLTFNQLKELQKTNPALKIKKGTKQKMVIYWNIVEKTEKDEETDEEKVIQIPVLRYYKVFHQSDIENLESKLPKRDEVPKIDLAEAIIKDYTNRENIEIRTIVGGNRACYVPSEDIIKMPHRNQFVSSEEYYATLFHELAHSTGHSKRLDRFNDGKGIHFGDENYSKEELIAEITANMIFSILNIENTSVQKNSTAYLYGWLSAIKKDATLIISAAKKAEVAANYILGDYAKELFAEEYEKADAEVEIQNIA